MISASDMKVKAKLSTLRKKGSFMTQKTVDLVTFTEKLLNIPDVLHSISDIFPNFNLCIVACAYVKTLQTIS